MSYSIFFLLALLASWITSRFLPRDTHSLPANQKWFVGLIGFSCAVFAAKLPFVILPDTQLHNSGGLFFSGKTILLGLVGGYLGVELAKWRLGIRHKTGDQFAVPVSVGVGIGRLGCFFSGCCYGTPTDLPWGVRFSSIDAVTRHPVQLYELAFHLLMAFLLYILLRCEMLKNQLIKLYFLSYFAFRFATEFIRPEIHWASGLSFYQWAIMALTPVFIFLWTRDSRLATEQATSL